MYRRHTLGLLAAAGVFPSRVLNTIAPQRSEIRESLARHFADEGTAGTFVCYSADDYLVMATDRDRSGQAFLPESTFELALSLIALEIEMVRDPDEVIFKWDGVKRGIEAWDRDHTLRSAMAESVAPVHQEIARRIGAELMQNYVNLIDYGNRNIGGGIDRFWLAGDLRIDPFQQVDFVDRLRRGALPVSKRGQDLVRDLLPVARIGNAAVRCNAGLLDARDGQPPLGWVVGWAEKGSSQTVFALNADIGEPRHAAACMTLAQRCLADVGAI
jgi:beta-lactamase class D